MSIFTRARYALARMALKGMSWSYMPAWVSRTALSGAFNALTREGYQKAAAYFACISTHAFTFPEAPLWVWDGEDEQARALPLHPLRRLLMTPNPDQDEAAIAAQVITWAAIGGNCYIHKVRNRAGLPIMLRPYHDGLMRPVGVTDPDGIDDGTGSWVSHYLFRQADGREVEVPKEDVIHFQWPSPDPLKPYMAQPPILAAARDVDTATEATRMVAQLLANDAMPRTVITQSAQQALTKPETDRMRAEWRAMHGGENIGGIAILEAGAAIQRLGMNMQELDVSALHNMAEQHICAVMKVPSPVAGLGDDPTYANSEEASARFAADVRVPLWQRYAAAMHAGLVDEFGGRVFLRHYMGRVAALQENADAKAARVFGGFDRGLLGFREARAALGITAAPDPDDLFVLSISRELVSFAQLIAPPAPSAAVIDPAPTPAQLAAPPDDTPDGREAPLDQPDDQPPKARATKAALRTGRALQRTRNAVADRMAPRVAQAFAAEAARVEADLRGGKAAAKDGLLPGLADLGLDGDFGLLAVFRVLAVAVVRESWELWNTALDVELAFDETDPAVVAAVAQAGDRIAGITETTRAAVRALLIHGTAQGWGVEELLRGDDTYPGGIGALISQTYAGRDRAIARTELGFAQQRAAVGRYAAAGVATVTVLDNGTEDSDPACTALNGTTQTLAWAEANLLGHPNCVRAFAPNV